jgi:uncharacterized protein YbaR (Trm112 family)
MKKDILDIICCPTCKGGLLLQIDKEENDEIIKGKFLCEKCNCIYPIENRIPNLLPK